MRMLEAIMEANQRAAGATTASLNLEDFADSLPLIRLGKLRALGITTAERAAPAPDIPPLGEVGVRGYDAAAWSMRPMARPPAR